MPFYATDDLTCFAFSSITGRNESLWCTPSNDTDEQRDDKKMIEDIVYNNNRAQLKELCKEIVLTGEFINNTCLCDAILNSIDLDKLNEYLRDWLADCDVDEKADAEEELVAKMKEVKRLIDEKQDAYSNLAKIAAEMDALADNKVISRPYNDCSCKSSCACDD